MYYYPAIPYYSPFQQQQQQVALDLVLDFETKLYIGCIQGLNNYQSYGIKAIISVCGELQSNVDESVDHLIINVNDRPQTNIIQYFKQTNAFIQKHMDKGNNILVHCAAGKSRSATIVLAYLMKNQNWSLEEALLYLKSVRQKVNPNPGFIRQLLNYEQTLFGSIKSQLNHAHTPYFNVQNPDTIIPETGITQQRTDFTQRRSSFMAQQQYPTNNPYLQDQIFSFRQQYAARIY